MRPKTKEIELYTSIDTLLFYNWDRYLATKDNWFIIGYDGRQAKSTKRCFNAIRSLYKTNISKR
jgi:hypothetical protein